MKCLEYQIKNPDKVGGKQQKLEGKIKSCGRTSAVSAAERFLVLTQDIVREVPELIYSYREAATRIGLHSRQATGIYSHVTTVI